MSSILKALKKLEEEKSRLQEEREINVSREILRQQPESGRIKKWPWLLAGAAAVVIIVLTLALIRATAPKVETKAGVIALSPQPASPQSQPQRKEPPPGVSGRGVAPVPPAVSGGPKTEGVQRPSAPAAETPASREKTALTVSPAPPPEQQRPEPVLKPQTVWENRAPEPALTLSGIAWNKDSADRLAIINGQPTATGGTVSGAVVEEILQDRVKLSLNGRIVELFIGRNARTD